MNLKLCTILFNLAIVSPYFLSAKTYYVSTQGSDRNPGTSSLPFLTIQRAANIVNPGDEVIIRSGIYATHGYQLVEMRRGGTAEKYVTFRSEKKWGAVLTGGGKGSYGIIIGDGASFIRIKDLEIKNFLWMGIHANDSKKQSNYIIVEGNKIHDIGRVSDSGGNGRNALYIRMKNHHWRITRNLIYNIGRTGPDIWWNKDHAVYTGYADSQENVAHNNEISYNIIFGCSGHALQLNSRDDLVANNVIAWTNENSQSGTAFIAVDDKTTGLSLVNNIFYQPPSGHAHAVGATYGCQGWTVSNNIVYGGRMWDPESRRSANLTAMKGANFCRNDCSYNEINPLFISAYRRNAPGVKFDLKPGSPAINAGIDLGLRRDFYGNPIIGKPDIGAVEFQH